ncbi:hypothetical protein ACFX2J_000306 [Malus domestica]
MWQKRKGLQLVHHFTSLESYKRRKIGDGHSVEFPKPLRIIPKSDVEEKMKQEHAQFETLVVGNGKGKSKAKAKEALVFKHLMKVMSVDATVTPHTRAWNDVDQATRFQDAQIDLNLTSKAMYKRFEIQAMANCSQQKNGPDCGLFLLKFADYISSGLDIDHVQPQNMPFLG